MTERQGYAFCVTAEYAALLLLMAWYAQLLFRNQPRAKRQPQKVFLVLGVLQCMCRATYVSLWPYLNENLDSPLSGGVDDKDNWWMNILGSFPPCLFLSMFSVNVFTVARIYHTVLGNRPSQLTMFTVFLIVANIVVYIPTLIEFIVHDDKEKDNREDINDFVIWATAAAMFLIGTTFITYSTLLFYGVRQKQIDSLSNDSARYRTSMALHRNDSIDLTQPVLPPNPMKKLVIVSSTCMLCFLFRSVAVPFIDTYLDGKYGWLGLWVIFNVSEIIPMLLMLYIFEGRGNSGNEVAPAPYTKLAGAAPPIPATRASTTNNGSPQLGVNNISPQAPPYMPYAPPQLGGGRHGGRAGGSGNGARDSPRSGNGAYGSGNHHNGNGDFGTPPTPPFSVERGSRFDRFDRDRYDEHNRDLFALD